MSISADRMLGVINRYAAGSNEDSDGSIAEFRRASGERVPLSWREATQTLEGWTKINGQQIYIRIPRQIVHSLSIYNDAVGWEIERFKADIVQRLAPSLLSQAAE